MLGPDDSERIITICNERMSSLVVQVEAPEASAKWELRPKAELSVSDGDSMTDDGGEEVAKASLDLMTGDDSYNLIEQTASESRDGHTLTERGSIEAFQQRTTRGHDNKPMTADLRIMRLDQRGVTETGPGNRVEAYSPLIRLPH